jgi:hypothetical protein
VRSFLSPGGAGRPLDSLGVRPRRAVPRRRMCIPVQKELRSNTEALRGPAAPGPPLPPPPPVLTGHVSSLPRTNWTRLVPSPVLTGHVSSLPLARCAWTSGQAGAGAWAHRVAHAGSGLAAPRQPRGVPPQRPRLLCDRLVEPCARPGGGCAWAPRVQLAASLGPCTKCALTCAKY